MAFQELHCFQFLFLVYINKHYTIFCIEVFCIAADKPKNVLDVDSTRVICYDLDVPWKKLVGWDINILDLSILLL